MQPLAIKHDLQPVLCNLRYADYTSRWPQRLGKYIWYHEHATTNKQDFIQGHCKNPLNVLLKVWHKGVWTRLLQRQKSFTTLRMMAFMTCFRFFLFIKSNTTNLTFYYTVLITTQYYRDDTMGSERQWLPHGQHEKTRNVNLNTTNTTDNLISNGYYTRLDSVPHQM